jgi:hypothetical protein
MAKKKKKSRLKKLLKGAALAGAAVLGAKALGRRNQMKDYLATEGGDRSDMRDYGPFSKGANYVPKRSMRSIAGDFINKINDKTQPESGMQFYDTAVKMPGRVRAATPSYNDSIIQQYKKGGRVGCGKAKRGFGRAMPKGRKK